MPPDLRKKTPRHCLACPTADELKLLHPAIPELLHLMTQAGSCWWRLVMSLLRDWGKSRLDGPADGSPTLVVFFFFLFSLVLLETFK
jgi:hypothetical protein